jgi:hypothetical protein
MDHLENLDDPGEMIGSQQSRVGAPSTRQRQQLRLPRAPLQNSQSMETYGTLRRLPSLTTEARVPGDYCKRYIWLTHIVI